jgi:hypothetical protein
LILGLVPFAVAALLALEELLADDLAVAGLPLCPTAGICPLLPLATATLTPLVMKLDDLIEPVEIFVPTMPFDVTTVLAFLMEDECEPPR